MEMKRYLENEKTVIKIDNSSLASKLRPLTKIIQNEEINYSSIQNEEKNLENVNDDKSLNQMIIGIEDQYTNFLSENSFLKKEFHSIIPFLLLKNCNIHRLVLSDYELKQEKKEFKLRKELKRITAMDYYKKGLIYFYQGDYVKALTNFKLSSFIRKNNSNIKKWIIFCCYKLILKKTLLDNKNNSNQLFNSENKEQLLNYPNNNDKKDDKGNLFSNLNNLFDCCSSRNKKNENIEVKEFTSFLFNKGQTGKIKNTLPLSYLIKEFEEGIDFIITNTKPESAEEKENIISIWWLILLLSSHCLVNKGMSKMFTSKHFQVDPKIIVKRIRKMDNYLAYIMYIQSNYIIKGNYYLNEIIIILDEIIKKYPQKIEAYLIYWEIISKSSLKDYDRSLKISHKLYSNILNITNEESEKYKYYIVIIYAKSLIHLGKFTKAFSILKNEFVYNLSYTSILYYIGKGLSKLKIKNFSYQGISILEAVSTLLYSDLKLLAYYWTGYAYYNNHNYVKCYKFWLHCYEQIDFFSKKKRIYIDKFINKYKAAFDDIFNFKVQHDEYVKNVLKIKEKVIGNTSMTSFCEYMILKNSYQNLKSKISFNINENFQLIINYPYITKYYFSFWKCLKKLKDNHLLLTFSIFLILSFHYRSEIPFNDIIKGYVYLAKALAQNNSFDKAISILLNLVNYLPFYNIQRLKFLDQIYQKNNISQVNTIIDKNKFFYFHSKEDILGCHIDLIRTLNNDMIKKEKETIFETMKKEINNFLFLVDKNSMTKMNSGFINLSSYIKILYNLGKICAKSKTKIYLGIISLSDFSKIIKFSNNFSEQLINKDNTNTKYKAKFYLAQLYTEAKDYKKANKIIHKLNINIFSKKKLEWITNFKKKNKLQNYQ